MRQLLLPMLVALSLHTGAQSFTPQIRQYIRDSAPSTMIRDVTVYDGRGGQPKMHQSVLIGGGLIRQVGNAGEINAPEGALVIEGSGKTVIPGLVMLHEHLYYTIPIDNYFNVAEMPGSFPRLYLASGCTTMRTAGSIEPQTDLAIQRLVREGRMLGPEMDVTAPYFERKAFDGFDIPAINVIKDTAEAVESVKFWADKGCTSLKMFMHSTRDDLRCVVREAHKRGLKVTGHLGSITYKEAAEIGIDDLEHGFLVSSDFDSLKQPEVYDYDRAEDGLQHLALNSPKMKSLISLLVKRNVALTSTLAVFEPFTGREVVQAGGQDALLPEVREQVRRRWEGAQKTDSPDADLFSREQAWEKQFYDAGGLLVAGSDPTGSGRTIAGYSNYREIELLVEGGFTVEQAIKVCTMNGAIYLKRDREIGSIEPGKRADLVLIAGDIGKDIRMIRHTEIVYKQGVGFDSQKIFASVKGWVGMK